MFNEQGLDGFYQYTAICCRNVEADFQAIRKLPIQAEGRLKSEHEQDFLAFFSV